MLPFAPANGDDSSSRTWAVHQLPNRLFSQHQVLPLAVGPVVRAGLTGADADDCSCGHPLMIGTIYGHLIGCAFQVCFCPVSTGCAIGTDSRSLPQGSGAPPPDHPHHRPSHPKRARVFTDRRQPVLLRTAVGIPTTSSPSKPTSGTSDGDGGGTIPPWVRVPGTSVHMRSMGKCQMISNMV